MPVVIVRNIPEKNDILLDGDANPKIFKDADAARAYMHMKNFDDQALRELAVEFREKTSFDKEEIKNARRFLEAENAQIVDIFEDNTIKVTKFKIAGRVWVERASKLESPHDGYTLELAEGRS